MTQNIDIPQGYKDSPLGIIPQEWEVRRLDEVVDTNRKISYGIVQTGELVSNGMPCIRVVDLVEGKIDKKQLITTSEKISHSYRKTIVTNGDIVIALRGKVGESVLITDELSGCNLTRGVALISNCPNVCSRFLIQQISSPLMKIEFEKKMNGSALQEIPINVLRGIETIIPPLEEQERIAEVLGCWDEAIERQGRMVKLLTTRKRALMQRLLTPQPHWQKTKLGDVGGIITGNTPSMNISDYYGGDYCWATAVDFTGKYIYDTVIKLTKLGTNKARMVPENSVLVTCIASIGKNSITKILTGFNQQINAIVPNANFDAEFIYYQIENSISKLKEIAGAGAVQIINKANFENVRLSFPPLAEQKSIAEKLSTADAEIDLARRRLDLLRTQKRALMQQLLTGKKQLRI